MTGYKTKPAVIGDGGFHLSAHNQFCRPLQGAVRDSAEWGESCARPRRLADDFRGDVADAGAGQADGTRRGGGEVEYPALHVGATVIDGNNDAAAVMGHAELGAEGQRTMRAGQLALVEALARGRLPAGFVAVEGGETREHAPHRLERRGCVRFVRIRAVPGGA